MFSLTLERLVLHHIMIRQRNGDPTTTAQFGSTKSSPRDSLNKQHRCFTTFAYGSCMSSGSKAIARKTYIYLLVLRRRYRLGFFYSYSSLRNCGVLDVIIKHPTARVEGGVSATQRLSHTSISEKVLTEKLVSTRNSRY